MNNGPFGTTTKLFGNTSRFFHFQSITNKVIESTTYHLRDGDSGCFPSPYCYQNPMVLRFIMFNGVLCLPPVHHFYLPMYLSLISDAICHTPFITTLSVLVSWPYFKIVRMWSRTKDRFIVPCEGKGQIMCFQLITLRATTRQVNVLA